MKREQLYLFGALGAAALVVALILFGPGQEPENPSAVLWKESWEVVEYYEAPDRLKYRFVRDSGLFQDRYFFEGAPLDGASGAALVRYRGNYNVKNLFTDWQKPQLRALYNANPDLLKQSELEGARPQLRFYSRAGADPIVVNIGKTNAANATYITTDYSEHRGALALLPSYLFEKVKYDAVQYRERRFLDISGDAFIQTVETSFISQDKNQRLVLRQERRKVESESEGETPPTVATEAIWLREDANGAAELPKNLVNQFDGALRQIQRDRFADEPAPPRPESARDLWSRAGANLLELKVQLSEGESPAPISVRRPPALAAAAPLSPASGETDPAEFYLIKSADDDAVHWVSAAVIDNLLTQAGVIAAYRVVPANPPAANGARPGAGGGP